MLTNILQYLEATAPRLPEKLAFSTGTEGLTFSALHTHARTIGAELLRRGHTAEPVAVLMDKHPHTIATFFGALYAGCFYAALDGDMPPARMGLILDTLRPRLLICDKKNEKTARRLVEEGIFSGELLTWDELCYAEGKTLTPADEDALAAVRARQIDTDPIYVVFTSGSTGVPKGVAACHRSVIDYTESLCEAIGFDEHTVFANQTPLYFDAPLKEIMPTIKFGATAYLVPKMLFMFPVKLCDYLNEHRINTVCWVVSALTMISSLGALEKNSPRYLTTVCFGSEVFPRKQYDLWRQALPKARFFNLYGPTEATGMSCYWPARDLAPDEPIPVGKPFRNTDLLLLTDDGRRAAPGEAGEICLRGTCVTLGYYGNPEKTAEAFVQNPLNPYYPELIYRTGDMGRFNDRGELLFISRRDAQIKHMGHRIELGEIEAAAAASDGVRAACCVYDANGKRIALYYVGEAEPAALTSGLKSILPRYMLPAICERLPAMPLTPNGKADRKGLRERAEATE
jgi:amino acid adenylation domain-containing protein